MRAAARRPWSVRVEAVHICEGLAQRVNGAGHLFLRQVAIGPGQQTVFSSCYKVSNVWSFCLKIDLSLVTKVGMG